MSLVEKFQELPSKTKHFVYGAVGHVVVRAGDVVSTIRFANRDGIQNEANPVIRYLMETHGVEEGMLMATIPVTLACIGAAKLANDLGEQEYDNHFLRNLGNYGLYIGNAIATGVVIHNFS